MRTIDMQTWSRREHFELFSTYGYPHFGMCANVDLTAFYPAVKERGYSLTVAIVYTNCHPKNHKSIRSTRVTDSARTA
jgi:chloramphenicol O-acetyltransferase type A